VRTGCGVVVNREPEEAHLQSNRAECSGTDHSMVQPSHALKGEVTSVNEASMYIQKDRYNLPVRQESTKKTGGQWV